MSEQMPKLVCGCGQPPDGAYGPGVGCSPDCMLPEQIAPSTPDTDLRDRVLAALQEAVRNQAAGFLACTDAVLAVVQPELDRLRAELDLQGEQITRLRRILRATRSRLRMRVLFLARRDEFIRGMFADWEQDQAQRSAALRSMARRVTELKRVRRTLNQRWHDILLTLASTRKERDDARAERDRLAAENEQLRRAAAKVCGDEFLRGHTCQLPPQHDGQHECQMPSGNKMQWSDEVPADRGDGA